MGQETETNNNATTDTLGTPSVRVGIESIKNSNADKQTISGPKGTLTAARRATIEAIDSTKNNALIDSTGVKQDSIKKKNEILTDKVTYKATDYERISQRLKKIFLYNEAEVLYEDMKINAGEIILDYETCLLYTSPSPRD